MNMTLFTNFIKNEKKRTNEIFSSVRFLDLRRCEELE